jgi:hypothetical protein
VHVPTHHSFATNGKRPVTGPLHTSLQSLCYSKKRTKAINFCNLENWNTTRISGLLLAHYIVRRYLFEMLSVSRRSCLMSQSIFLSEAVVQLRDSCAIAS